MTPPAFTRACHRLVGRERGWIAAIADLLECDHHTITRYGDGRLVVPKRVQWALYGLEMCKKHDPAVWGKLIGGRA